MGRSFRQSGHESGGETPAGTPVPKDGPSFAFPLENLQDGPSELGDPLLAGQEGNHDRVDRLYGKVGGFYEWGKRLPKTPYWNRDSGSSGLNK